MFALRSNGRVLKDCVIIWSRNKHNLSLVSAILESPPGTSTSVQGWVKNVRQQKENVFINISDGSCSERLQVVIAKDLKPPDLNYGCSVEVSGNITTSPRGQKELHAENVKVVGKCVVTDGYPFNARTAHPPDYTRQYLHLRSRTNYFAAVLRVRNTIMMAMHNFFQSKNYLYINTPVLTSNDCEGAGEVFRVTPESDSLVKSMMKKDDSRDIAYFGSKTYLTVSGQLQLEAIARGLGNVYTIGPTFRAENSKSRLHLSEFYMLEAELAFCKQLEDIQETVEKLIKYVLMETLNERSDDLATLRGTDMSISSWLDKEFTTLTYKEAHEIISKKGEICKEGINKEQELLLVEHCGGIPVFVVEWPKELKSFYMKENSVDGTLVDALDLLAPLTGEIVGGSLREDNYDKLKMKIPSDDFDWYLDIRKYGNAPTGGFGLGVERFIQVICNVSNIKDTIPFPRWPHNCSM